MINDDNLNQRFNFLIVLYRNQDHIYPSGRHEKSYHCICDCGNEIDVLYVHLKSGHTKSCGCFRKIKTGELHQTHSMSKTRLYRIWKNMKSRCSLETRKDYKLYGERGISVCDEWNNDFNEFKNWSIINGYSDNLTLDRINVNGNYQPDNCRWISQKEQCNNTRRNLNITFKNKTHTLKEWSEILGINYKTLQSRIKRGCSYEKALTTKNK